MDLYVPMLDCSDLSYEILRQRPILAIQELNAMLGSSPRLCFVLQLQAFLGFI